jgi:hypothetical protein
MLVTLVAILCNQQLCIERVVPTADTSSMTAITCSLLAQQAIAMWMDNGPYKGWKVQSYKCVIGNYVPKREAQHVPL